MESVPVVGSFLFFCALTPKLVTLLLIFICLTVAPAATPDRFLAVCDCILLCWCFAALVAPKAAQGRFLDVCDCMFRVSPFAPKATSRFAWPAIRATREDAMPG